jgi:hypothetical protein
MRIYYSRCQAENSGPSPAKQLLTSFGVRLVSGSVLLTSDPSAGYDALYLKLILCNLSVCNFTHKYVFNTDFVSVFMMSTDKVLRA